LAVILILTKNFSEAEKSIQLALDIDPINEIVKGNFNYLIEQQAISEL